MTTIHLLSEKNASDATKALYAMIKKQMGKVPNIYQVYGHSSAALKANLQMDALLNEGVLTGKEIEVVALTVSTFNNCEYCIAAHSVVGKMQGMTEQETIEVRRGESRSKAYQVLIDFTYAILNKRGKISETDLERFKKGGYTDAQVIEVIGQIAKNVFNNYTNHIAGTPVDFPAPPNL